MIMMKSYVNKAFHSQDNDVLSTHYDIAKITPSPSKPALLIVGRPRNI